MMPVDPRSRIGTLGCLSLALLLAVTAGACTQQPTPYQPMAAEGGYQETRLQERMYRVSFQGNPGTQPGAVLDMALLRCGELTREAGYAAFVLLGRSAEAKLETASRWVADEPLYSGRGGILGAPRLESFNYVRYHEVTLLMRMLPADGVKAEPDAFDADDLVRRLARYRAPKAGS